MLTLLPSAPTTTETDLDTPPAIPAARCHIQGLLLCSDDVCPVTGTDSCPSSQAEIDKCGSC